MNMTKMAMVLVLGSFGAHAFAENAPAQDTPVQTYGYSTNLDIEHVISITEPANECAPVPVQMTYEDSHGERHVLQYQVMGTGCSS
ncbi:DUF2790 domain-containing protein [Pseudomonas sp. MPR-ANC1]|uniref:DUF2790 domain-containing protein n=1 Tax=Pseudomonas sp. MPR-ANC1 TaxID=2075548 RepID=UPI000CD25477|nr:DUF2790 domain-containing protein [Pseudomonas sp. MPR-ANC1]POA41604.1 DUF2790 domain-containing protein [Pseudomonas sp. MPR-ANC1]